MTGDWSDEQNDAIVADYLAILVKDIAGQPYSKAEHNRLLQAVIYCPRGSIEYKHHAVSPAFHPAEARVPGGVWRWRVGWATVDRRNWSGLRSLSSVAVKVDANVRGVR